MSNSKREADSVSDNARDLVQKSDRYGVWGGSDGGGWCHMWPEPRPEPGYPQEWCGTREEAEATLRTFQNEMIERAQKYGPDPDPPRYELAVFDPDREPVASTEHVTASPVQAQLLLSIEILSTRPKPLPRGAFPYDFNTACCSFSSNEFTRETLSRVISYGWAFSHPTRRELVLTRAGKDVLARAGQVKPRGTAAYYLKLQNAARGGKP